MQKSDFICKAESIFGKLYDYFKLPENFKASEPLEIICSKHGSFMKSPGNHLYKKQGCPVCSAKNKSTPNYTSIEFIEKLKTAYIDSNYSFDKVDYKGIDNNIIITCPEHGDFTVKARYALHKHTRCPKCSDSIKSKENFIKKAVEIHGNKYDYSKVIFTKATDKVEVICPKHGSFWVAPVTHISSKSGCPKCGHGTFTVDEFIAKATEKFNGFYDYSRVKFEKNSDTVEIICPKHGSFWQKACLHLKSLKNPCPECRKILTEKTDFIDLANSIHGLKYDYSEADFINMSTPVKVICPKHGAFYPIPNNHISKHSGCPKCATAYNHSENELKDYIKSLGFNIIENDRTTLRDGKNFYELDCFIPEKNIAVEFDGLFWHSADKKDKNYHLDKTEACNRKGIRLIHIFEDEWIFKKKIVKFRLKTILGKVDYKIQARKCTVKEISSKKANKFIEKYHIQGKYNGSIRLGLFYRSKLAAVMTFGKSRFNKKYDWELLRYCTISNFSIIGGAGKLFAYFKKNYNGSIVTYADRRWSDGTLYRKLGFTELKPSTPAYWYFKGKKRFSRTSFQKHLLENKLESFDPNKSEMENMKNDGYSIIYDCGNFVFESRQNRL